MIYLEQGKEEPGNCFSNLQSIFRAPYNNKTLAQTRYYRVLP